MLTQKFPKLAANRQYGSCLHLDFLRVLGDAKGGKTHFWGS